MSVNKLFQYSVGSALMEGVASTGVPLSTLLRNGNHGLGTFRHLDGEMIILDGTIYMMKSDGSVRQIDTKVNDSSIAPFGMVTHFEPTMLGTVEFADTHELFQHLCEVFPDAKNHYLAIRLDGTFKSVVTRTVGGQSFSDEGVVEVAKRQAMHRFKDSVRGTAIGFRSPAYMQGIGAASNHLHFITDDRTHGGHILSLATDGHVGISAAAISGIHLELPTDDPDFNAAELPCDAAAIAKVFC
jgi:alpha-acetolactate decarboxylase